MCVYVCVCVCVCVCAHVYAYISLCLCARVFVWTHIAVEQVNAVQALAAVDAALDAAQRRLVALTQGERGQG